MERPRSGRNRHGLLPRKGGREILAGIDRDVQLELVEAAPGGVGAGSKGHPDRSRSCIDVGLAVVGHPGGAVEEFGKLPVGDRPFAIGPERLPPKCITPITKELIVRMLRTKVNGPIPKRGDRMYGTSLT